MRGFDPRVPASAVPGVQDCAGDADAARGCALVISLTCADEAEGALSAALPGLGPGAVYADLNTASSGLKVALAERAAATGVAFADVALMSPVPGNGLRTPMLASGPAAEYYARIAGGLGASVDVLAGPPGTAAARKLVRSVFYKGMAAAVVEALRAAAAAGCEDWLRDNIRQELTAGRAPLSTGWSRAACSTRSGAPTRWQPRPRCCANSACRPASPRRASSGCGSWRASRPRASARSSGHGVQDWLGRPSQPRSG